MKTVQPRSGVIAEQLRSLPLFSALPAEDIATLAAGATLRQHARGDLLFRQGDPGEELHCLLLGAVRVVRSLPDGREKVLHLQRGPAPVAEAVVLAGEPFPSSAECTEECLELVLPRRFLLQAAASNPDLPWRLIAHLAARLRELTASLSNHAQRSAAARLASFLLGLSRADGAIDLPAPKKDVASYLGLRPESLSRALAELQQRGAITLDDQQIHLIDRTALERVAGEE